MSYLEKIGYSSYLPGHGEILRLQRHLQIADISLHYLSIRGGHRSTESNSYIVPVTGKIQIWNYYIVLITFYLKKFKIEIVTSFCFWALKKVVGLKKKQNN
jgi:hypothetical protein